MKKEIEMMRVMRVPPLGKLVIDANEERYTTLTEVSNPKMRQRLLAAIGELVDFCGGYSVLEDAGVVPQITPSVSKTTAEQDDSTPDDLKQQQAAFLANLQQQVEKEKNTPPKKSRTASMFSTTSAYQDAKPVVEITEKGDVKAVTGEPKPLSIAEQIDEILQKLIVDNPEMANRGICLKQSATGGLQILADGKSYEKPADIEDKSVQLIIKTAVKKWNASQ